MSKELLKQALLALQGYRRNHDDQQPCDTEKAIEAELAKPEPEPVAYCTTDVLPNDHPMSVKQYPKISLIKNDRYCIPVYTTPPDQAARIAELENQLEIERMKLAGCSVAALSNTDDSIKDRIDNTSQYWSASYGDVCAAVDREMSLRKELAALQANQDPLTSDQVRDVYRAAFPKGPYVFTNDAFVFARMIEKAHGIGK